MTNVRTSGRINPSPTISRHDKRINGKITNGKRMNGKRTNDKCTNSKITNGKRMKPECVNRTRI
ncbi:MAG: hypothetical protein FWG87_02335 [Defluviitaleaceae bacterium]|nr:hypothetical protein [Defluviitaleaceae bacterium]